MGDHSEIIRELGGPHRLARDLTDAGLAVKPVTARAWALRNSIPAKYWSHIQGVSTSMGKPITITRLAERIETGTA